MNNYDKSGKVRKKSMILEDVFFKIEKCYTKGYRKKERNEC